MRPATIRIGGVPEHFNLPVHIAIENRNFQDQNINVEWVDYPNGTGGMTKALREGECDICILLTEGIVTDIIKGSPSKIVSGYVNSPLTWGIYTQIENPLDDHLEIFDKKIAVSQLGSGSHLMPIVNALMCNKTINDSLFMEVSTLPNAIDSLKIRETEILYWEKFTTKPYLREGRMKKIGEFISPWSSFVIAATNKVIKDQAENLSKVLKIIQSSCHDFMKNPRAIKMIYDRYKIEKQEAERWFHATEWTVDGWVSNKMLEEVADTLKKAKIVESNARLDEVIWKRNRVAKN